MRTFDDGQRRAWTAFVAGSNVAVVGPAGCGKSRVLLSCIQEARQRYGTDAVLVMAWTWAAAGQIDGQSYHSHLGISTTDCSKEHTLELLMKKPRLRTRLEQSRVVVVDEAPTFPGRHFTQLEFVLRSLSPAHMQGEPWGGRQVLRTFRPNAVVVCLGGYPDRYWSVSCSVAFRGVPFLHLHPRAIMWPFLRALIVPDCSCWRSAPAWACYAGREQPGTLHVRNPDVAADG